MHGKEAVNMLCVAGLKRNVMAVGAGLSTQQRTCSITRADIKVTPGGRPQRLQAALVLLIRQKARYVGQLVVRRFSSIKDFLAFWTLETRLIAPEVESNINSGLSTQ